MIKNSIFAHLIASLCFIQMFAQVQNGMLIFLDDSEYLDSTSVRAIYMDFISALRQKAGPILVSRNILSTVARRYSANHALGQKTDWLAKYTRTIILQLYEEYAYHDLLLEASGFDPSEWIIKKINDNLYMLIPMTFVSKTSFELDAFNELASSDNLTPLEFATGLKINHMETIPLESITHYYPAYSDYFLNALYDNSTKKSSIFCLNAEYATQKMSPSPIWSISALGHGSINDQIIGMSIASFKQFLKFLAQKINTSLFAYTSCYAAGLTTEKIYSDVESAIQMTYPYAIITKALTEAPTNLSKSSTERVSSLEWKNDKVVFQNLYTNYSDFLLKR